MKTSEVLEYLENETIWANSNKISDLFGRDKSVISRHLKNIFLDSEMDEKSNIQKNALQD